MIRTNFNTAKPDLHCPLPVWTMVLVWTWVMSVIGKVVTYCDEVRESTFVG